jgi:hypothetical protein
VALPLAVARAVWLINYRHFLSWKPFPGSWIPDPSTLEFSVAKATFYFKVLPGVTDWPPRVRRCPAAAASGPRQRGWLQGPA